MGTVTVNGVPLKEVVEKQISDEVQEVRESENRYKRLPIISTHNGNHSGERTGLGRTIYTNGQKETHVIISNTVFPWEAKAPYVKSGESVLGAIEYNQESDEVKCHECGKWVCELGQHVGHIHQPDGISAREYRLKHGIALKSSINSIGSHLRARLRGRESLRVRHPSSDVRPPKPSVEQRHEYEEQRKRIAERRLFWRSEAGDLMAKSPAIRNLRGRCEAQIITLLQTYAAQLGHTPSVREMNRYIAPDGSKPLCVNSVQRLFGIKRRYVLLRAGLIVQKCYAR